MNIQPIPMASLREIVGGLTMTPQVRALIKSGRVNGQVIIRREGIYQIVNGTAVLMQAPVRR